MYAQFGYDNKRMEEKKASKSEVINPFLIMDTCRGRRAVGLEQ